MSFDLGAGDLIAVSGRGPVSWMIQAGTLSPPNIFGLGRWGLAGASHVGIVVPVFGQMVVYESTSFARPPCVRTNRQNPKGVQAHLVSDIISGGGDVWHYPLRRPLYYDEIDRLVEVADSLLGRGYDYLGAARAGGARLVRRIQRWTYKAESLDHIFCSELAAYVWAKTGILACPNSGWFSPAGLVRHASRNGVIERGQLLS